MLDKKPLQKNRGVVGFMLTVAVGVAIGAATLVVSNEISKENKKQHQSPLRTIEGPSSPQSVQQAYIEYQRAYLNYQTAVKNRLEDTDIFLEKFHEARRNLEIEIFRNTPGVSEMDLKEFIQEKEKQ